MNTNKFDKVVVEVVPTGDEWVVFGPSNGIGGAEWARFHTERECNEWADAQGYLVADLRWADAPLDIYPKRIDSSPGYVE